MKVTEVIETFYFLKTFLISVNAAISFHFSILLHCNNLFCMKRTNFHILHRRRSFPLDLLCERLWAAYFAIFLLFSA